MDHVDRVLAQWAEVRPDLDTGPMGIMGRLTRLHNLLHAGLDEVYARYDLNFASFDVLATLRRSGAPFALSPSQLVAWTMVTSGTMTNRIDRLAKRGLIERRANPEDGRSALVALTQEGHALIDGVVSEHVANQHRLIEALGPDERRTLDGLLRRWLAAFDGETSVDHTGA